MISACCVLYMVLELLVVVTSANKLIVTVPCEHLLCLVRYELVQRDAGRMCRSVPFVLYVVAIRFQ